MLGKPENPGIIPRICTNLFELINNSHDSSVEFAIDIQVVEIYCEVVNDLLVCN